VFHRCKRAFETRDPVAHVVVVFEIEAVVFDEVRQHFASCSHVFLSPCGVTRLYHTIVSTAKGATTHKTKYDGPMTTTMLIASAAIAARTTRLATHDTLTAPLRDRGPRIWRDFASCPYCIGWWITLATFAGGYAIDQHGTTTAQTIWVWVAAACAL